MHDQQQSDETRFDLSLAYSVPTSFRRFLIDPIRENKAILIVKTSVATSNQTSCLR